MISYKIATILVLVVSHTLAVLNNNSDHKAKDVVGEQTDPTRQVSSAEPGNQGNGDKKVREAMDRISSLSNEYGPPRGSFNGPAPTYGLPPGGNYLPAPQFPPALSEFPTLPLKAPAPFYGPPRNPGSSYPPPKYSQFGPRPSKIPPWKLRPGHGPAIPISLEAYGPPSKPAHLSFQSKPTNNYGPPKHSSSNAHDIFSKAPRPGPPPPGVAAPPTPPDIKYDGWQPIMGYIPPQGQHSDFGPPDLGPSQPAPNIIQSASDSIPPRGIIDGPQPTYVPHNSYGEPITSPDAHSLKQSVQNDNSESGLPPPVLPETEILHNVQHAAKSLPPHSKPVIQHQHEVFDTLTLPNIDVSNDLSNLPAISAPAGNHHENFGFLSTDDFSLQQLPSFTSGTTAFSSGSSQGIGDSYLAPPPSSFSSSGPYPASHRPIFSGSGNGFFQNHRHQHTRHFSRNPGPSRPFGGGSPFPPIRNGLIPPRTWSTAKFREPSTPVLPPPSYGVPQRQPQQPTSNCPSHSVQPQLQTYQNPIDSTSFNQALIDVEDFPAISQLELDSNGPHVSHINPIDSYGNSIGYHQDQRSASSVQTSVVINDSSNESTHESGASGESVVSSAITSQGYNQPEGLSIANFDELNKFHDGSGEAALALAQTLSTENASSDNFQIQGSQGTYTLQIHAADGAQGTENSDGSIRHEQVLSNGLLQDILAAIEQPENAEQFKLQGEPQIQSIEEIYQRAADSEFNSQHLTQIQSNHLADQQSANDQVQLFFNNGYSDNSNSRNQIRSTSKEESVHVNNKNDESNKQDSIQA